MDSTLSACISAALKIGRSFVWGFDFLDGRGCRRLAEAFRGYQHLRIPLPQQAEVRNSAATVRAVESIEKPFRLTGARVSRDRHSASVTVAFS